LRDKIKDLKDGSVSLLKAARDMGSDFTLTDLLTKAILNTLEV
jgi:hypothetical protein